MITAAYTFDWSVPLDHLGYLLGGLKITVLLSATAMAAGLALGLLVALARMSPVRPLSLFGLGYVELFRAIPLLIGLYWIYYALPALLPGLKLSPFLAAFLLFTLNLAALNSEAFRSGLLAVPDGQRAAALSLGMEPRQAFLRIVLPQAVRRVMPVLANTWVGLFKDTSIVVVIALSDITYRGQDVAIATYRPLEVYTLVLVIYFIFTWPQARGLDRLFRRYGTD
jgi:His/Glu/Gln/Arg/opine family amino acid ABC transporter permease subunit